MLLNISNFNYCK